MSVQLTARVGSLEVLALHDAAGSFGRPWNEMFPDAGESDWRAARRIDPAAFHHDGTWNLRFGSFAVRRPDGRVTVVDTGIGPVGSPATAWAPVPGRLPRSLTEAGIGVDDVDTVVLTHLHGDHVGWAVASDSKPLFPGAVYLTQAAEIQHLEGQDDRTVWEYVVEPLTRHDQLALLDGRTRLAGGGSGSGDTVTAVPTPGHTVGHQSVLVEGGEEFIVITGDVLVHAIQFANAEVGYLYEHDQVMAAMTRQQLFREARRRGGLLATMHLNEPFLTP